jgi:hypothetical protein
MRTLLCLLLASCLVGCAKPDAAPLIEPIKPPTIYLLLQVEPAATEELTTIQQNHLLGSMPGDIGSTWHVGGQRVQGISLSQ